MNDREDAMGWALHGLMAFRGRPSADPPREEESRERERSDAAEGDAPILADSFCCLIAPVSMARPKAHPD
jgi:hypothetical protein